MARQRRAGHAETPFIVGMFSLVAGAFWATLVVAKHEEYTRPFQVFVFVVSPLVGLLFFALFVALMLGMGWVGERLDHCVSKWRALGDESKRDKDSIN